MNDRIVVNFAALSTAAGDIGNALSTMRSQLDEAEQTAKPLVDSWDGPAREAYQLRQQKWTQAANDIATMLGEIQKAVIDSADEFQTTEQRNTNLFQ
ncbi:WXG100 family type VII secretion target [Allorhizocola rhizosphaerae]|uniref:WXG100 family type VII secretion target n=1 Tax=Allorhizocola rhizosphaerae TaxID=1872709 RepID=UPI001FE85241|nr:WXG100 family type VII secretion target [Allorhizocola rhizosphaerae]